MHEHRLVDSIVADILRRMEQEPAGRVTRVLLRVGGLTELDGEAIVRVFAERARGTVCEGAEVVCEPSDRREVTLVSFEVED